MRIQGLGVIDEASIELHRGLTVVTGETGAGKTMVVTGLHLLSGGRGEASRVRTGAERAVVEGRFHTPAGSPAAEVAANAGADPDEDGSLIVVRTVNTDGRSRAHLGGRSVPVGVLSEISEQLIAVHGQNDQLRLTRPAEQRGVLDRFAGEAVAEPLGRYRELREQWVSVSTELIERTEKSREMAREADLLKHGLAEIEAVDPKPGEDEELHAEARRLADVDQLREASQGAQYSLSGPPEVEAEAVGAMALVAEARRRLLATEDPKLRELEPRLAEASVLLTDVATELVGYIESLDADPARLEQVLARQAELKQLTRKYAADVDGVLEWARVSQERLAGLDTSEEALAELARRRDELAGQLAEVALEVSAERAAAAEDLGKAVTEELGGLAMAHATVEVAVLPRIAEADDSVALLVKGERLHAGRDGVDDVELRLIAHPGAPALPVNKGASGGELSRVMLALEVVLSHADPVPTLVFDEVDAGVGGRAAVEVGRRLARLARSHQVIVVTHLPQVAAYADRHLVVNKVAEGGLTSSGVRVLDESERVVELARMLAGLDFTYTGRAHAEELLDAARTDKKADEPVRKTRKKAVKR
ncbi:DNA repair protein RecN (Recombination protein N) [Kutzneria buriramensis]|uniref:DNA repair protein RecN n=2 Tax=Kutzneria buriramensis TaxID=1045776 RepID=A0A3E0I5H4_9PSEU|nr:DNA repair protein RecN (Recombination protein N) [Kutzneria buriramensis]